MSDSLKETQEAMLQIICIKYQHLVNILPDHLNNKLLGKKMMPGKADLKCKHVVARSNKGKSL